MAQDRDRLRTTFDGAALLYDEVRPGYPENLFDDVVALSGIPAGGRVPLTASGVFGKGVDIVCGENRD
jgi:hypothetical protein